MALTPTPVCVQTPKTTCFSFGSSYVANTVTAFVTAGINGNKIVALTAISQDSGSAHVVKMWQIAGGTNQLSAFSVPASSGNDGATNNANMFQAWNGLPRDNDGQVYFFLEPNQTLAVSMTSTLSVGLSVGLTLIHAQF